MQAFLSNTVSQIRKTHPTLSNTVWIVPSNRAARTLQQIIASTQTKTEFAPKIYNISTFFEILSGLKQIDTTTLLCTAYIHYAKQNGPTKEPFEMFSNWAAPLLQDINEIDLHLVSEKEFLSYMRAIKSIERWGRSETEHTFIKSYLKFWESSPSWIEALKQDLLEQQQTYTGQVYRYGIKHCDDYLTTEGHKPHFFIGFNALTKSEDTLFQSFLAHGNTQIFWDVASYYFKDPTHLAGYYFRKYIANWPYYKQHPKAFTLRETPAQQKVYCMATEGDIGQVKYVGQLLENMPQEAWSETAIVLADESLLNPLLQVIPKHINTNITKGINLQTLAGAQFFELLFTLQSNHKRAWRFQDLIAFFNNHFATLLWSKKEVAQVLQRVSKSTRINYQLSELLSFFPHKLDLESKAIFDEWQTPTQGIKACINLLEKAAAHNKIIARSPEIALQINALIECFNGTLSLVNKFPFLNKGKDWIGILKKQIASKHLPFAPTTAPALHVMGLLETRTLDFKKVIILSVNEKYLPKTQQQSSYLTNTIRNVFNLPLPHEKEAVFSYHFYRLLHTAQDIHLVYKDTTTGGQFEKSRFINQLLAYPPSGMSITTMQYNTKVAKTENNPLIIPKTPLVLKQIETLAANGFSASSLTNYIRNPVDFYFNNLLRVRQEENMRAISPSQVGTIVHETIKMLYSPFVEKPLQAKKLEHCYTLIDTHLHKEFTRQTNTDFIPKGKNYLLFELAKTYIKRIIASDILDINQGHQIVLLDLEKDFQCMLESTLFNTPIKLKGIIDRIDTFNGQTRIIDYKTGQVTAGNLQYVEDKTLTEDYKFSKTFQLLFYAYLWQQNNEIDKPLHAAIFSVKKPSQNLIYLKEQGRNTAPTLNISLDVLNQFKLNLEGLISELFNPKIPLTEKPV